ncbi:hypothetical protein JOQ06_020852, partial [Pogonophryne albipinna]
MAQTNSGGQGTNGVADESPNMIVYRKTALVKFIVTQREERTASASVCAVSSADRRRQRNVSMPASSCFALIGIRGTRRRPERLLHVPRRN